jgi:predicted mannosyl-3-phosphoglycerate phosphatase (HAD superfamily)
MPESIEVLFLCRLMLDGKMDAPGLGIVQLTFSVKSTNNEESHTTKNMDFVTWSISLISPWEKYIADTIKSG